MKQITAISIIFLLASFLNEAFSQNNRTYDYNLQKAYDIINEEKDYGKALEYVEKQLLETPDDVETLLLKVRICLRQENYRQAMVSVNNALAVNKPKKSGFPNSTIHWWKGYVYEYMKNYEKAADSYKTAYQMAKKDNVDDLHGIGFDYSSCLHFMKRLDESDRILKELIADDDSDVTALVGLARNLIDEEQYEEALNLLQTAENILPDYYEIYRFKVSAYDNMGRYRDAIDAAVEYLEKAKSPSSRIVTDACLKQVNYAVAILRSRIKESSKPFLMRACLCTVYERSGRWEDALREYLVLENESGKDIQINERKGQCYRHLGMLEEAINELNLVIEEKGSWNAYCERGACHRLSGNFAKAIEDFTSAIDVNPRSAYPYYARGWCKELSGKDSEALEDYNLGIDIDTDYPYIFLQRGLLLKKMGRENEAQGDFETVLQKDTLATKGSCTHYALAELGRYEESKDWMGRIIQKYPEDPGIRYDEACLYTRIGLIDEALEALEKAFKYGYRNFIHMEYDHDMDPVRNLPRYKDLVAKYKVLHEEKLRKVEYPVPNNALQVSEISFSRQIGGTFEIPCRINGLSLRMLFDTGASDVTISSLEANFMFKNGYLAEKDIKGKRYYQVANGEINEGTVITLREVEIGDAVLHNVDASVVKSQKAPLLFGQSAMERFGAITIDNQNNKLIIKH